MISKRERKCLKSPPVYLGSVFLWVLESCSGHVSVVYINLLIRDLGKVNQ